METFEKKFCTFYRSLIKKVSNDGTIKNDNVFNVAVLSRDCEDHYPVIIKLKSSCLIDFKPNFYKNIKKLQPYLQG